LGEGVCCVDDEFAADGVVKNTTTVGVCSEELVVRRTVDAAAEERNRGNIKRRPRPREASRGLDVNGAYFSTSMVEVEGGVS
jgi:hypothetical protein